jgi:hypothetical protein
MSLRTRIGKLERAVACEACEARDRFVKALGARFEAWGVKSDEPGFEVQAPCDWCGARRSARLVGVSISEAADFEEMDALYWRGEMCLPEFEPARNSALSALKRATRERYGEANAAEAERMVAEYNRTLDAIRQPPLPYLCRVPGCVCNYPKTIVEWTANVRANGYSVAA